MQQAHDGACRFGVEVSCRLISNYHLRLIEQRAGNGHTLLLATGEFVWALVFLVKKPHLVKHLVNALVYVFFLLPSCRLEYELEVAVDVAVVEQLEILEDDAHLSSQRRNVLTLYGGEVASEHLCLTHLVGIEVQLTVEGLEQRTLS